MSWDKRGEPMSESTMWIVLAVIGLIIMIAVVVFFVTGVVENGKDRVCYWSVLAKVSQNPLLKPVLSNLIPQVCYTKNVFINKQEDVIPVFITQLEDCSKRFQPALNPPEGGVKGGAIMKSNCFVCSSVRVKKGLNPATNREIVNNLISNDKFNDLIKSKLYIPTSIDGIYLTDSSSYPIDLDFYVNEKGEEYQTYVVIYAEKTIGELVGNKLDETFDSLVSWSGNKDLEVIFVENDKTVKYPVYVYVVPYDKEIWGRCY